MANKVTQWLSELGLDQYTEQFHNNAIEWSHLPDLDHGTLQAIGVEAVGHRLTILKSVEEHLAGGQEGGTDKVASDSLTAWERHPGERKPVTILFADITGSTGLTEKLDAEDVHDLLYGVIERICAVVERNRGTVCKIMGDGVMAMFGAPNASEHHALEASSAALDIQMSVHSELPVRVGLHSGEVVVLNVGDGDRVEYDASGPAVSIAARMEQAAEPGQVYITQATASLAGNRIEAKAVGELSVKGISDPVSTFVLTGVRSAGEDSSIAVNTRFVGRRSELIQFGSILDVCVGEGLGQIVYVRGEPGIGKTRLVEEFTQLASAKGIQYHRGLVFQHGVGKGQDAIRSLVRSLLGVIPGKGKDARMEAANKALGNKWIEPEQKVFLYDLLDLEQPLEQRTLYDAMENAMRNAGKEAVLSRLTDMAGRERMLLVVVEDIHWADAQTLALLSSLARNVSDSNLLLLMTSRIDGDPLDREWLGSIQGSPFTAVELGPLRNTDAREMVSSHLGVDDDLAKQCLDRAAGNPLFLEQLLRTAREGKIDSLPESIQSLVLARVDRLDEADKHALRVASVIGQKFDGALLNHLLGSSQFDCGELLRHNLVRHEGSSFLFTHALIHEGVYGSLLKRQRAKIHRQCADYFENSDRVLHAEHLGFAGDENAAGAFLTAAEEQAALYRYENSLHLAEKGLEMAGDDAMVHRLRCVRGELQHELDDIEGSMATFREVLDDAGHELRKFDGWMGLAAAGRVIVDLDWALELLDKAEPIALRHKLTEELGKLHHLRGNLYYGTGNIKSCYNEHKQAQELARQIGSIEDEARALGGIADAECADGKMRSAYESFRECIDRCREIGLGRVEVANRSQLANCFFFLGTCEEALESSRSAVDAACRIGHLRAEVNGLEGICNVGLDSGDYELMVEHAHKGYEVAMKLQAYAWAVYYQSLMAAAHHFSGDSAEANRLAEEAVREGQSSLSFVGGWTLGVLAMVSERAETRIEALRQADELVSKGMNGEGHLHYLRFAMQACWQAGMWDELDRYANAMDNFTREQPLPWSDFFIARGRVLSRIGRGDRSDEVLNEVARLKDEAGRQGYLASIDLLDSAM